RSSRTWPPSRGRRPAPRGRRAGTRPRDRSARSARATCPSAPPPRRGSAARRRGAQGRPRGPRARPSGAAQHVCDPRGHVRADVLAPSAGRPPPAADLWLRGAYAHRIIELVSPGDPGAAEQLRFAIDPALAQILLDEDSNHYLGGQFVRSVDSTLDYADLGEF